MSGANQPLAVNEGSTSERDLVSLVGSQLPLQDSSHLCSLVDLVVDGLDADGAELAWVDAAGELHSVTSGAQIAPSVWDLLAKRSGDAQSDNSSSSDSPAANSHGAEAGSFGLPAHNAFVHLIRFANGKPRTALVITRKTQPVGREWRLLAHVSRLLAFALEDSDDARRVHDLLTEPGSAVAVCDRAGSLVWANPGFCARVGLPFAAIAGCDARWLHRFEPELAANLQSEFQFQSEAGDERQGVGATPVIDETGETSWIALRFEPRLPVPDEELRQRFAAVEYLSEVVEKLVETPSAAAMSGTVEALESIARFCDGEAAFFASRTVADSTHSIVGNWSARHGSESRQSGRPLQLDIDVTAAIRARQSIRVHLDEYPGLQAMAAEIWGETPGTILMIPAAGVSPADGFLGIINDSSTSMIDDVALRVLRTVAALLGLLHERADEGQLVTQRLALADLVSRTASAFIENAGTDQYPVSVADMMDSLASVLDVPVVAIGSFDSDADTHTFDLFHQSRPDCVADSSDYTISTDKIPALQTIAHSGDASVRTISFLASDIAPAAGHFAGFHGQVSALVAPLVCGSVAIGTLSVCHSGSRVWTADETRTLAALADLLGQLETRIEAENSQRRSGEQLKYQAHHDELTGLPNRRRFLDSLNVKLAGSEGAAVLLLDIDHFKAVNDAHGHPIGDRVLVTVADRLRQTIRAGDTPSRLSGDEFAVLSGSNTTQTETITVADRLVELISTPIDCDGVRVDVTASVGVAFGAPGDSTQELRANADRALYLAKDAGRNQFAVFDIRTLIDPNDPAIHQALRQAIRNTSSPATAGADIGPDAGSVNEIEVHYQPEIDLETGMVCGIEALVRWRRGADVLVPARSFIDVADATELIIPLGQYVQRASITQAARWQRENPASPFVLRVNVSAVEFVHPGFVDTLAETLATSGLAPERLQLDIAERLLVDAINNDDPILDHLDSVGVGVVVDDLGTGFSSSGYLNRDCVQALKIDRGLIADLNRRDEAGELIESIAGLAQALNLEVVAHGIETDDQAEFIRKLGCNRVQGFLFGAPVAADIVGPRVISPQMS